MAETVMKDAADTAAPAGSESATNDGKKLLEDLKSVAGLLEKAVTQKEPRFVGRALRTTMTLRRQLDAPLLNRFLEELLPSSSDIRTELSTYLQTASGGMEVDAPSADAGAKQPGGEGLRLLSKSAPVLPELTIFLHLLVTIFLIDQKQYQAAKACSSAAVAKMGKLNRRSLDALAAKLYYYYSWSHELTGCLEDIRTSLLSLHRTATLRHDDIGQETLLNLILRNYLHYSLYDQAEKFRSKSQRPESKSNTQFCRYLFYLGRIRAVQLEYSDAKECLLQASRKAPQAGARGFRLQCAKWSVLVRLLLGEIPERTLFMAKGMRAGMAPYFELTNTVRIGDLAQFHAVMQRHEAAFRSDRTHNLITRLHHNVIRTGLRRIGLAYSRISLADVAAKLALGASGEADDAEGIVCKAVRDGGLDARVDHANGWMVCKETSDIYSTQEPMAAFHARISFCLNIHNEAVTAMRFPPDAHKGALESIEKQRERQQQEQELAQHLAEEGDDDF
eukprot:jgi/Mesvir1/24247/Mv10951-RA.1